MRRPRVVKLPAWVTKGYGAWTLFSIIFISDKQASCPADVRRYVLGHEVGHLCGGHQSLQYFWVFSQTMFFIGMAIAPAIALTGLILMCVAFGGFVHPALNLKREVFADRVAVELYGPHSVVVGATWMARQLADIDTTQRQARLKQLRSYLRDDQHRR